ncbi:MAG: sugar transferase, partial [Bacteroidia bacterium]
MKTNKENQIDEDNLAPIILFVYNRLDLTQQTINALKKNDLSNLSELFIFSDGPKNSSDESSVKAVRAMLVNITGFKEVYIFESDVNKGLANSIILGVTNMFNSFDKVIVLEDDLYTTPNFLRFMNASLNEYESNETVYSISGYSFNLGIEKERKFDTYFLNRGWSWGWATWKNRWEKVDWEVKSYEYFRSNNKQRKKFAQGGSDLNKMLDLQMKNKLDSWAIRWFYHQFLVQGLTVYPIYSKIYNHGFGV